MRIHPRTFHGPRNKVVMICPTRGETLRREEKNDISFHYTSKGKKGVSGEGATPKAGGPSKGRLGARKTQNPVRQRELPRGKVGGRKGTEREHGLAYDQLRGEEAGKNRTSGRQLLVWEETGGGGKGSHALKKHTATRSTSYSSNAQLS